MSLDAIFGIAGSGLNAQSLRLNTTASNMANAQSASSSYDEVYRARHPVFTAALNQARGGMMPVSSARENTGGVQVLGIVESDAPLQPRYEPEHPLADDDGYVYYPNVNVVEEMANMISASRSFQANVEVMNSAKQMMQRVLTIGQ
ncbi:flagellar basal body rod protein FlgC [Simiduia agarivorans]|uniref:Flagellar basal-body rod protein FlgC n=1 Tax=Simiduia agarivorans (strain DSM 21679 / JCM 13881 / BCRC 17597 / SA1) TaxID=1117647 RepID=K4KFG1_SIMAS|nr:flagellar basal body rod protein FlgC [Simiduia agarivorans]AFU97661.1 flagellar basal body rod protein FlgC [Simiduia agarivorans SA1 = DSM 21679]